MPMRGRKRRTTSTMPTPAMVMQNAWKRCSPRVGLLPSPRSTAMGSVVPGQKSSRTRPSPREPSQIVRDFATRRAGFQYCSKRLSPT